MNYRVLKPFRNIDGSFLKVGDSINCTENRATILRNNGMIGNRMNPQEIKAPIEIPDFKEYAIKKKTKREYRKRK